MKNVRTVVSRVFLLLICLIGIGCTKSYKMQLSNPIEHGGNIWQGYFLAADSVQIPLRLGMRQDDSSSGFIEGYLVSGTQVIRKAIFKRDNTFEMQVGLHSKLVGTFENDSVLKGSLIYSLGKIQRQTPFSLYLAKDNFYPYKTTEITTLVDPTGTWELEFPQRDSIFYLVYDLRNMKQLDIYRSGDTIISQGYISGEGTHSMDGVLNENGFTMASFHHGVPFLVEANFIDSNEFNGKVYNDQINYPIIGKRKNQLQEDKEFTSSVTQGFIQFIQAFFNR
ncbi:hypothetical protein ACYSNM_08500 [Myroides sp. LJL116]